MPTYVPSVHVVVRHPWRETPKGEVTLLLDPHEPALILGILPENGEPSLGEAVDGVETLSQVNLHRSPDERVPDVAADVAQLLFDAMPAWLDERLIKLLNGIHGFGTSRNPRGPAGKSGMDHPLAPLGIWGPAIDKVGREVRRGRFESWADARARLEPVVTSSIEDATPEALRDDILGVREPRILLREPL